MPAPAGMCIAHGLLLAPGFLQVSQKLSLLSNPRRSERQRGELWNPVVRGFNHKSVQTGSIPWASENEGVLVQGSTCHLKGRIQGHQPLASHRVSGAPSGPPPLGCPQQNK